MARVSHREHFLFSHFYIRCDDLLYTVRISYRPLLFIPSRYQAKLCPLIALFTVESGWHLQLYTSLGNDLLYLVLFDKKTFYVSPSIVNRVQVKTNFKSGRWLKSNKEYSKWPSYSVVVKVSRGRRRWCIGSGRLCSSHISADWSDGSESTWPRTILLD